jgi:hypothetical protein
MTVVHVAAAIPAATSATAAAEILEIGWDRMK